MEEFIKSAKRKDALSLVQSIYRYDWMKGSSSIIQRPLEKRGRFDVRGSYHDEVEYDNVYGNIIFRQASKLG